jgi:antitoxin component YwqK of YwqJK toxin-antitoxin module
MHGPWVRYHENGELAVEGSFRDGEFDGPWVSYEEDGTINLGLTGTFKNGVKVN